MDKSRCRDKAVNITTTYSVAWTLSQKNFPTIKQDQKTIAKLTRPGRNTRAVKMILHLQELVISGFRASHKSFDGIHAQTKWDSLSKEITTIIHIELVTCTDLDWVGIGSHSYVLRYFPPKHRITASTKNSLRNSRIIHYLWQVFPTAPSFSRKPQFSCTTNWS